jgi:hypothetical protein
VEASDVISSKGGMREASNASRVQSANVQT